MSRIDDVLATDLPLSLPLTGRQLVEASAGTGKTYTIAGLYARLVIERHMPVRQLLVMTYTRAATEELRQRLRQRLVLCRDLALDGAADPGVALPADMDDESLWAVALLRRAVAVGEETPAELARRLRMAVANMDEAAIFTIHGFCQRVLDGHASLLEGAVAGATLVPNDDDLLEEFAADFWLRIAGAGDADQLTALRKLAGTPLALGKLLRDLLPFAGPIEPAPGEVPPPVDVDGAWRALLQVWLGDGAGAVQAFNEWFVDGRLNGSTYRKDSDQQLARLNKALSEGDHPDDDLLEKFAQSKIANAVKKGKPAFPAQPAFAAIDRWLEELARSEARRDGWQPVLLHQAVDAARGWLARRKQDLARVSYNDLIARLAHAVAPGAAHRDALIAALRQQYPVALVDEFQDTDARQFGILDTLYRGCGPLYMIGDPKQAIYSFRGGDVQAYLQAARGADARHALRRNFRSCPALLRAVEAVFQGCDEPFIEDGIVFEHVESGGHVADGALQVSGEPVSPLTFWSTPTAATADARRDAMARACAVTVADLLRAARLRGRNGMEPLQPGRVAVLTRTNDEAALVQDALRRCGVPAVCLRKESIYGTHEARELLYILDALLTPSAMPRARAALATELMGCTLAGLARMAADEVVWNTALTGLADLARCWFGHGILAMIEHLAEQQASRLLALADGERRMSNLLQLGDLLEADGRKLAGPRALRDGLAAHVRDADSSNEDEQLRLESDAQCVQIVTVHRSKGLEYDVVLMPFTGFENITAPAQHSCAYFHRAHTAVRRFIVSDKKNRSADDVEACNAAKREDLAEGVRKLYVGLTRARYACWTAAGGVVLAHLLGGDGAADALVADHADCMAVADPESVGAVTPAPRALSTLGEARAFTRVLARDWWRHSFSQWAAGARDAVPMSGGAHDESGDADENASVDVDGGQTVPIWPRGPRYGNAVHAILEKTDFALWQGCTSEPPAAARALMVRELRAAGYAGSGDEGAGEALSATARLVAAALNTPVVDKLRLADLAAGDRCAEMTFGFGIAGASPTAVLDLLHRHGYQTKHADYAHLGERLRGLMTGIIDLAFRHAGKWWIVDYKTNNLGPRGSDYARAKLPAAIAAHDYDLQYLIYTVAMHRWLRLSLRGAYDYERDFGGVRYLFVRGMTADAGVFDDKPPAALIQDLDALLHAAQKVAA